MELGGGWNDLGWGGWSWVELGARFSNTYLDIFSFIADIRPSCEYPFDKQNKLFSYYYFIIIINIIIIDVDSGSIYKYNGSSSYKLKKI